jgi:hypothetical protein
MKLVAQFLAVCCAKRNGLLEFSSGLGDSGKFI